MTVMTDLLLTTTTTAPDAVSLANRADAPYIMLGACFVALGSSILALAGWLAYAIERASHREAQAAVGGVAAVDTCCTGRIAAVQAVAAAEDYLAAGIAARGKLTPADYGAAHDIARGNRPAGGR